MHFDQWEREFQQTKTTKLQETKVEHYKIKWFFESFIKIVSKTTFLAQLSLSLDFQLSHQEVELIETKIEALRGFYAGLNQALCRYLGELPDETQAKNLYFDFLNNFYKQVKIYLNRGMIPALVGIILRFQLEENYQFFHPEKWDGYMMGAFQLSMMKKMRTYIKQISQQPTADQVYALLTQAYEQKIIEQDQLVKQLKKDALVG